jgi:hypothetical protein
VTIGKAILTNSDVKDSKEMQSKLEVEKMQGCRGVFEKDGIVVKRRY